MRHHVRTTTAALAAATLVLAACSGDAGEEGGAGEASREASQAGDQPFAGEELVVANWKDYGSDRPWAVEEFEEQTGATVTHQYFTSEEELLTTLREGGVGEVDVALPNLAYITPAIDEGLLQPVDPGQLEHLDELDPRLRDESGLVVDGERYGVPWMWGSTALAYDTDELDDVSSWDALWDPGNAGQVAFFDDAPTAVMTSALHLGEDPYDPDLDAVRDDLLALKDNTELLWASADDWLRAFSGEGVVAGNLWSGTAGTQIADGDPLAYVVPDEGAPGWLDTWTLVADAPNPELAHAFIDYMSSEGFQTEFAQDADASAPAPANAQAAQALPDDVADRVGSDPAALDALVLQRELPDETLQAWTRLWQEVKAD